MKTLDLRNLTKIQIEILIGLVDRAIYEYDELSIDEKDQQSEIAGFNAGVQLQTLKRWLTLNS